MKNIFRLLAVAMIAMVGATTWSCSDDDDDFIPVEKLPQASQSFVSVYYPQAAIVAVEKDKNDYEVVLSNGHEITFDRNGDWTDIDAPMGQTVPEGIVPGPIQSYIDYNYNGIGVNEISIKNYGYEVELANGLDLKFNADGTFIGIDR